MERWAQSQEPRSGAGPATFTAKRQDGLLVSAPGCLLPIAAHIERHLTLEEKGRLHGVGPQGRANPGKAVAP
jgi:hypothetical protein